jgi:hypothetical protein
VVGESATVCERKRIVTPGSCIAKGTNGEMGKKDKEKRVKGEMGKKENKEYRDYPLVFLLSIYPFPIYLSL